jgi:hypothetical protein
MADEKLQKKPQKAARRLGLEKVSFKSVLREARTPMNRPAATHPDAEAPAEEEKPREPAANIILELLTRPPLDK